MSELNQRSRHGLHPLIPGSAYALLTFASLAVPQLIAGAGPWTSQEALQAFYREHQLAARLEALFAISAAMPLAVLTAVLSTRLRQHQINVPGPQIALIGGAVAAGLLGIAGLINLALIAPEVSELLPLLAFGQQLKMALGGTGFAAFMGLLVAGIAVPGVIVRVLPRALAWIGIVLAFVCELAVLTTLTPALNLLLPIARFGSLLWLLTAASTLSNSARH
jgi:hypothetical protein